VRLSSAVEELPNDMRTAIVMRIFHQQPWNVVAEALGRSPGAVRVLWTRAIRRLRETLVEC
jgi:RNA polymerase sigma factor (sigma-70 family)